MRVNSARLSSACILLVVIIVGAHAQEEPCATASKFGPNDQIGNLNYVTPAKTLAVAGIVDERCRYDTALYRSPDGHFRRIRALIHTGLKRARRLNLPE